MEVAWARTITFAGLDWEVRSETGGPGPNNWSDSADSVWVDATGQLHLRIRSAGETTWYCSEIRSASTTRHGMHRFYTASRIDNLDKNVVFSPFLYLDDHTEMDIEFSRWQSSSPPNAQFVVQPAPYTSSNRRQFTVSLEGDYSTHYIDWRPASVHFKSFHGHYEEPPSPDLLIQDWTYTGGANPSDSQGLRVHINLWLIGGLPPSDGREVEVVVPITAKLGCRLGCNML
jgi:hypothetical protein